MASTEPSVNPEISKNEVEAIETVSIHKRAVNKKGQDKAAELINSTERIHVSPEQNKRVLRKIDLTILPILLSVYCLQSLDKTTLSYASVFGLIEDANLDPNSDQYSWLGSIVYIAQLVMQPLISFMLVKLPIGKFTGVMVFTWGAILCGMAGATNYGGLMATRFLLGAFEAAVGRLSLLQLYIFVLTIAQLQPLLQWCRCGTAAANKQTETLRGTPCWVSSISLGLF